MNADRRPIWITREEIDRILDCKATFSTWDVLNPLITKRYGDAPRNADEKVYEVLVNFMPTGLASAHGRSISRAILSALGMPEETA